MNSDLDEVDLKILELLKGDSRRSFQDIAKAIEMTDVTVRRRVKDLVQKGVIKKFTIETDSQKLGRGLQGLIRIEMKVSEQKKIMSEIVKFEEVDEAYYLAGKCGLWVKVDLEGMEKLEDFIKDKLSMLDGITNIDTCIVLKTLK
ncbi:MAG: Lrp/AsnC family transcriptional regulator [Candidatus Lokiarchaeota archaeon]|nr:Lrp/AsnC family transcriptional regulator [Candidatus Lokiarchaeota archaeon]